ncbi:MAG: cyclopropane fatty acyl phospholipid synthase [Verrucomicrobia bacterium]|nr:cyclopropane fatty acyl phospholipid synthase [Verrucomicrobiota bacterium]MBS0637495.1 cyclopropane fatty acyl phospholipid synthase [Verrucomicrobiota bacterium]
MVLLLVLATSCSQTNSGAKKQVTELFRRADVTVNGNQPWDIQVHNDAFYDRVMTGGSLALGETYMEGMWDSPHVDQFIYHLLQSDIHEEAADPWEARWTYLKAYLLNLQDKIGSKQVIDEHYQLGNDLYEAMLDPLMVYSCAYWKDADTLAQAQEAKFDLICRKLGLQPGMKVLDIGCGWGGFEKYAAEHYKVSMVGVTLSENQAQFGRKACQGLPVEILVKDYRDVHGQFDRILSIGMFEHVGKKNFDEFMEVASRCLKPDGIFLLHTIGSNSSTLVTDPWIHKYIFPNGNLPSIAQIGDSIENIFVMEDWHNFGAYYDRTLMAWYDNFEKAWPELKSKYGERFYRMWKYYLLSCAGSFRAREIQLWQIVLSKDGVEKGYTSIR